MTVVKQLIPKEKAANAPLIDAMAETLAAQQAAFLNHPMPSLDERRQQLSELKRSLLKHKQALCDAVSADYGQRSQQDTLVADILPCVMNISYTRNRLKKWMKPSRRHAGLLLAPAKVEVMYQPLGVVGIVVPWNFPVMLSIGPLITAIAAGNRAMLKLSEFTPKTNKVITQLLSEIFTKEQVAVFEGEAYVASAFTRLPFDHLLFTGSTVVGHHVMRAAAENLTPVTLELGGKSPVIIADDIPIELAVERMIYGKSMNAGQICVAPDYVLVPEDKLSAFTEAYQKQFQTMYPMGVDSHDFTSVINPRQYQRLDEWLGEAEQAGVEVIPCHSAAKNDQQHRMITHLLINPGDDLQLMQQEIFGPLLPIITYSNIEQALDYVRERPRPLALYLMSLDKELQEKVKQSTHAGGMAINETLFHVAADDAPFGGIGPSGMGHYHGYEGFLTFSKAKTVLTRGTFSTGKLITPPYGNWIQKLMLKFFIR